MTGAAVVLICTGVSAGGAISDLTSFMECWNSRIVFPIAEPISGSRFGPKNSSASATITQNSGVQRNSL